MREATPKLGRGLAALLGQDLLAAPGPDGVLQLIPVTSIRPSPYQPRRSFEPKALGELADSIARQGILQPVLVRRAEGTLSAFELVAGERRWRAATLAGLTEIPCIVRALGDSDAALAILVENLQRDDLNALDEADGLYQAIDRFGLTQEALASAIGKSRSHVANTLRLRQLPEPVREHLRAGRLTAGHARALLTHVDPVGAAELVIARGLSVRQTEAIPPTPAKTPRSEGPEVVRNPDLVSLERELSAKLGLAVSIADHEGAGRVSIRYRTLDQLDGILALLNPS